MSSAKSDLNVPLMSSIEVELEPGFAVTTAAALCDKFTEGYVLVFEKETPIYTLSIRNGKLVADKKPGPYHFYGVSWYTGLLDFIMGTPKPMKAQKWKTAKDDMLQELNESGVRYTLKEASDGRHIFAVVTVSRKRVKEYMDVHDFDLEIDALLCVKYARKNLPNFMLATNTFIPDIDEDGVDGVTIDGDNNAFRVVDGIKVPLLGLRLWKHIHIPYDSTLEQSLYKAKSETTHHLWETQNDDDSKEEKGYEKEEDFSHEIGKQQSAKSVLKKKTEKDFLDNRLALRAMYSFLTEDRRLDGCGFNIDSLLSDVNFPLTAVYATNDKDMDLVKPIIEGFEKVTLLKAASSLWQMLKQSVKPIGMAHGREVVDQIREHCGEQIAFYFAFLLHYQRWLCGLAPIGLIWFIVQLSLRRIAPLGSGLIVAVFIIWGTAMLENWRRVENRLCLEWGMMRIQKTEVPRANFTGALRFSQLTGQLMEDYASKTWFYLRMAFSCGSIALCLACVIASVIGIFTLRNRPAFKDNAPMSVVLGIINAVQINVFNTLYVYVATFLNDWEGHRLESDYYNHLVLKRVLFYVVNCFNSIVYLAFFQDFDSNSERLTALRLQLVTLFVSMIFIQNLNEVLLPIAMKKTMDKLYGHSTELSDESKPINTAAVSDIPLITADMSGAKKEETKCEELHVEATVWTDAEAQFELGPSPSVLDNTAEIVIQFGYVTLFAIVFPLMPVLAIVNNLVEFTLDLNLTKSRRPVPVAANGIGVWKQVLAMFVVMSVPTNMILLTFRTDLPKRTFGFDSHSDKLVFFFWTLAILIFVQFIMRYVVPDFTPSTLKAIERQFQCEKYLFMAQVKNNARDQKKQAIRSFKDDIRTQRTHRPSPMKAAFQIVGGGKDDIDSTNPTY